MHTYFVQCNCTARSDMYGCIEMHQCSPHTLQILRLHASAGVAQSDMLQVWQIRACFALGVCRRLCLETETLNALRTP